MQTMRCYSMYCDGGTIGPNPSDKGGTWAFRYIAPDSSVLTQQVGIIRPVDIDMDVITNNVVELWSVVESMALLPKLWNGTIYTDSSVTICRLRRPYKAKMHGVPSKLVLRLQKQYDRMGNFKTVLLSGHPTQEQLERGVGKGNRPVSIHNVWCDTECNRLAAL